MTRLKSLRDESGAVLVIVAGALLAIMAVAGLVMETANWFEHKRHLQLQADAAALAGGAAFQIPGCSDAAIYAAVRQYAGVKDGTYANPYNQQVGGSDSANLHVAVNSGDGPPALYWPNDNGYPGNAANAPCAKSYVDVKMTESNLPWLLDNFLVPKINAHARISMMLVSSLSGQLPIGVPDVNPQSGAVIFYDQANPGNLSTTWAKYLKKINTSGGLNEWSNTDATGTYTPASVTMPSSGQLGAVTAFSTDGLTTPPMPIAGMTVIQICAQARVDCYPDPTSSGLLFVHGEHAAPANKIPVIQDAILSTTDCADTYAYFTYNDANCTATLRVNMASNGATLSNIQLTAQPGGGCGGGGTGSGTGNIRTFTITIPAHNGPCQITMAWIVKNETNFPSAGGIACGANFNNNNACQNDGRNANYCPCPIVVQTAYAGNDDLSGPIRTAHLINMSGSFTDTFGLTCPGPLGYGAACNSFPVGATKNLAVDVNLAGAISTSPSDPPVLLRIVGGSRTGQIDCNASGNLTVQLSTGCDLPYRVNTDPNFACPWATKPTLLASPQPYPCVAVQTGGSVGQFTQGIQNRILGGGNTCPASGPGRNYWSMFPNLPEPDNATYPFNDPRIVYVFMVPFGSFRGSGNTILPVVSFGVFYVRGWGGNGNGNDDPCPGAIPNVPKGDLAGNFITHVATSANASGTDPCVIGSFNPCVAVLTK